MGGLGWRGLEAEVGVIEGDGRLGGLGAIVGLPGRRCAWMEVL